MLPQLLHGHAADQHSREANGRPARRRPAHAGLLLGAALSRGRPAALAAAGLLLGRRPALRRARARAARTGLLPAAAGRAGELAIFATRCLDMPFFRRASYCFSFLTFALLPGISLRRLLPARPAPNRRESSHASRRGRRPGSRGCAFVSGGPRG